MREVRNQDTQQHKWRMRVKDIQGLNGSEGTIERERQCNGILKRRKSFDIPPSEKFEASKKSSDRHPYQDEIDIEHENDVCHKIRHEAWKVAYRNIYSPDDVERYFCGHSKEGRTWDSLVCNRNETLLYELEGEIVACAKWAWNVEHQIANEKDAAQSPNSTNYERKDDTTSIMVSDQPRVGELNILYIHPLHSNNKIGRMLWNKIVSACYEQCVETLDIWVSNVLDRQIFTSQEGALL